MERGTCVACGALVMWARSDLGNLLKLNQEPSETGDVVITSGGTVHTIRGDLWEQQICGLRYQQHAAVCPGNPRKKP